MVSSALNIGQLCPRASRAGIGLLLLIFGLAVCLPAARLFATAEEGRDLSAICDHAAIQAARATGVPISVLKAISLTETGRERDGAFRPWPWTVNMEGAGRWFDTLPEARAFVETNFQRGARSFDVGCFQINYKWHHEAFASIDQMFEPLANALYAAQFLQSLFAEKGSWGAAAGAYHSLNPKFAQPYQARFETLRARFALEDGEPLPDLSAAELAAATYGVDPALRREVIRINTYPLLRAGADGLMGSLMPQDAAAGLSLASAGQATSLFEAMTDQQTPPPDLTEAQANGLLAQSPSLDPQPSDPAEPPMPTLGAIY